MSWFKRIGLLLVVNFLVIIVISTIIEMLGIRPFLSNKGIDYAALMIFCLIWGMGGAFISLLMSKQMAKWMMGVQIIDPNTRDPQFRELIDMVETLSTKAGLSTVPEIGIYASQEVNAFATGPSRSSSLVAVSSGLLRRLGKREVEGVVGHEIAHIANGDMVTMTLLQGVMNAFVMFLARALAYTISRGGDRDREGSGGSYMTFVMLTFVFQTVFMILGSLVVAAFSRWREFRADAGGAQYAGREKMIAALEALEKTFEIQDPRSEQPAFNSMKISAHDGGFLALFASHPPLRTRIERLKKGL
jgi:heat shock protein HtpX